MHQNEGSKNSKENIDIGSYFVNFNFFFFFNFHNSFLRYMEKPIPKY